MIGVVGGSGIYELLTGGTTTKVSTPYGEPSAPVSIGRIGGSEVAFIARHGAHHEHPAHRVNYRANLWALREMGVDRVIAPCAVGSLRDSIAPGEFVLLDQFIDMTGGRPSTFFDGPTLVHVSTADPYCHQLRSHLLGVAQEEGVRLHETGTVVVINGPRFSTRAESRWFSSIGGDVVNMTQAPEAGLARELGLCYAGLAMVTDRDAGEAAAASDDSAPRDGAPNTGAPAGPVRMEAVFERLAAMAATTRRLIDLAVPRIAATPIACGCAGMAPNPALPMGSA